MAAVDNEFHLLVILAGCLFAQVKLGWRWRWVLVRRRSGIKPVSHWAQIWDRQREDEEDDCSDGEDDDQSTIQPLVHCQAKYGGDCLFNVVVDVDVQYAQALGVKAADSAEICGGIGN